MAVLTSGSQIDISGRAPNGRVGEPYNYQFAVSGDPLPETTVTSGELPAGLTLSRSGTLSGTPTTAGTYTFTVTASNGDGANASLNVIVKIATDTASPGTGSFGS